MPIPSNPAVVLLSGDVNNYRAALAGPDRAHVDAHVRGKLAKYKKSNGQPKYPPGSDITTLQAFGDFFMGASRLGGQLKANTPANIHPAAPGTGSGLAKKIKLRPNGAIIHTKADGSEDDDAHEYMHKIFDAILYELRDLLEQINHALEVYNDNPTTGNSNAYTQAVLDYDNYVADLQPNGSSPYHGYFNQVRVFPALTNEGFIMSVRVELVWKNPYHSSSTVKVP
jgi:hypothetical protein